MNAVEFVKKFGWGEAKKAIAKVAWCETAYCTMIKHGCFKSNSDCCVDITDLKRLVESYELVEKFDGLNGDKEYLKGKFIQHHESAYIKLKQAIENVEKCQ